MKRASKKFANTVFVRWQEGSSKDEDWREVCDSAEDAAEIGETVEVAEYKLVRVQRVRLKPEISAA